MKTAHLTANNESKGCPHWNGHVEDGQHLGAHVRLVQVRNDGWSNNSVGGFAYWQPESQW
jgi:hypothetical protein